MNPIRLYLISNHKTPSLFRLIQEVMDGIEQRNYQLIRRKFPTAPPRDGTIYVFDISTPKELKQAVSMVSSLNGSAAVLSVLSNSNISGEALDHLLYMPDNSEEMPDFRQRLTEFIHNALGESVHPKPSDKIWVQLRQGVYQSLVVSDIKYVTVKDHYLRIYYSNHKLPKIKSSLKSFYNQHLSDRPQFYSLTRSMIINADRIQRIESDKLFIDNQGIPISRNKRNGILDFVGLGRSSKNYHDKNMVSWE